MLPCEASPFCCYFAMVISCKNDILRRRYIYEKLVALRRRDSRVDTGRAIASGTFHKRGGTTERVTGSSFTKSRNGVKSIPMWLCLSKNGTSAPQARNRNGLAAPRLRLQSRNRSKRDPFRKRRSSAAGG